MDDLLRRNRRSRKKRRKRSNSSSSSSDSSDCARGHSRSRQGGYDKAEKAGSKVCKRCSLIFCDFHLGGLCNRLFGVDGILGFATE